MEPFTEVSFDPIDFASEYPATEALHRIASWAESAALAGLPDRRSYTVEDMRWAARGGAIAVLAALPGGIPSVEEWESHLEASRSAGGSE